MKKLWPVLVLFGFAMVIFPATDFTFKVVDPVLILNQSNARVIDPLFLEMCREAGGSPQKMGFDLLYDHMVSVFGTEKIVDKNQKNLTVLNEYDDKRLYVRGILSVANLSQFHKAGIITDYYLRLTFYLEVLNLATGETYFGTSQTGISISKISDDIPAVEKNANLKKLYSNLYKSTIKDMVIDLSKRYVPGESSLNVVCKKGDKFILSKGMKYGIGVGEIYIPENKGAFPGVFKIVSTQPEFSHAEWFGDSSPPAGSKVTRSGGNTRGSAMLKILPMGGGFSDERALPVKCNLGQDLILNFFYNRLSQNNSLYVLPPVTSIDLQQESEANKGDIGEMAIRGQREWPDVLVDLKILYVIILDTPLNEDTRFTYKVGAQVRAVDFNTLNLVYADFRESQIEEIFKPGSVEFSHEEMTEVAIKNAALEIADAFTKNFRLGRIAANMLQWDKTAGGHAKIQFGKVSEGQVLDIFNMGDMIEFEGRQEAFYQYAGRIKAVSVGNGEFDFSALMKESNFKKGAIISGLESKTGGAQVFSWGGLTADSEIIPGNSAAIYQDLIISALVASNRISFDFSDDPAIQRINEQIRFQGKFALTKQVDAAGGKFQNETIKVKNKGFPETENSVAEAIKLIRLDSNGQVIKEKAVKLTRTFSVDLSKKERKEVNAGQLVIEELDSERILYNRYQLIQQLAGQLVAEVL